MLKDLKINIITFLSIMYLLFIVINDYLCFIFQTNTSVIFYIISFILCFTFYLLIRKKIEITKVEFDKIDIVFFAVMLFALLIRIAIPDSSFDTLNYHIYLQERPFSNNFSYNFFPARWINTYTLPLADRIHYFFRFLFGYRVGIIANFLFMIVIFYQVKEILNNLKINKQYASLISLVILLTEQLLANMMTYYVDLFPIPMLLQIILIIMNNKKVDNKTNFLVLFMSGILVSLKLSNAFFIIPLGIIYIIKYRKNINIKTFVFGIPILLFPLFIYLLNNYIQTGNPVFPFYNSIFKSKYLPNENWLERYYGPKNLKERLLWPIYLFKYPRRAFDTYTYYGRIGFGYIIAIFISFKAFINRLIKKDKFTNLDKISILYIIFCLMWSNFMMGYIRYALVLEVLSGIVMAIYIFQNFYTKKIISFGICIFCILGFMYTGLNTISATMMGTNESSWRYPYMMDKESYKTNTKLILNRKWDYKSQISEVDCFGIVDYNAGYAALLSNDKRVLNLNEGYNSKYGEKQFEKENNKCKNIYTISTTATIERTEKYMTAAGYKRIGENKTFKADFINYNNDLVIFEIERE